MDLYQDRLCCLIWGIQPHHEKYAIVETPVVQNSSPIIGYIAPSGSTVRHLFPIIYIAPHYIIYFPSNVHILFLSTLSPVPSLTRLPHTYT